MPEKSRVIAAVPAALALAAGALAAVPEYGTLQIQARTNLTDSFNLPFGSSFNSITPDINDNREVVFVVGVVPGTRGTGLWFGADGEGELVYTSPDIEDSRLSDPTINNDGNIATEQSGVPNSGVLVVEGASGDATIAVNPGFPFGIESFSNPQINENGDIGFRGRVGFLGNIFASWSSGAQAAHAAETGVDPNSPYSFLFTPGFNNNREIAGKVRFGPGQGNSNPDEIRVFLPDMSSRVIAVDRDRDPTSPYTAFDNSVSVNDDGFVVFTANLASGGRGVFLSDGATTRTIATTADAGVSEIEFFRASVNNNGLVVFRGKNAEGLQAIFVGDGEELVEVVTRGQFVEIDIGAAQIEQDNPFDAAFGGAPNINDHGDIVFTATLTPFGNNQVEYGTGVFVLPAMAKGVPGDTNGDGRVDFADLNTVLNGFGQTGKGLAGDVTGDDRVDFADLNLVLNNFGTGN